jgi:gliding motility-associated-like protein
MSDSKPRIFLNSSFCFLRVFSIVCLLLLLPCFHAELFSKAEAIRPDSDVLRISTIDTTILVRDTICSSEIPYHWNNQILINSGTYRYDTLLGVDSVRYLLILMVLPTSPPKPGKPVSVSTILCSNQPAQFSTQSGTSRVEWEILPGNAGIIQTPANAASIFVQWSDNYSGRVKVLAKSRNICGTGPPSDTLEVWVLPSGSGSLPQPIASDTAICIGTDSSVVTSSFPAQGYLWGISPVNAGGIQGTGNSIRVNWNPSYSGMAYVFYNSLTPCGFKKSDSLAIRIKPKASSSIINLDTVYCRRNAQVNLEGIPSGGSFFVNNVPVSAFSIGQPGLFQIRYQPEGCFGEALKIVRVRAKTAAVITSPDTLVCAGSTIHPMEGTPSNGLFLLNGLAQTQFEATQPGTYLISYHAFCTDTAFRKVKALAPPLVQIRYSGPGFCLDTLPASIQLQPAGGQLFHNGLPVPAFIPDYAGIHTLIYSLTESVCLVSDTAVVPVNTRPELFLSFDDPDLKQVCRRDTAIQLIGWPEQGFFASPAIQNSILNPGLLQPGLQTISYLGYNGVCLDSASLPLLVLDVPDVNAGTFSDSLCQGGPPVSLSGANPSGGYWTGPGISGNEFIPILQGINRLVYTLPAVDSLRCSSRDEREIFVKRKPETRIGSDTLLCEGQSIQLGNAQPNFQFSWNDGSKDKIRQLGTPGSYFFEVRDGTCRWMSDTLVIAGLKPLPVFSLGPDRSDCFQDSITFRGPEGMKTYRWEIDGAVISVDSIFKLAEEASLQLSVTDENGCSFSDRTRIFKISCPDVYVPEAFSPNGDGVNETWKVFGSALQNVNVKVFNLWGEVVYEGSGKDFFWDGNYKGQPCPAGVYQFVLQYSGNSVEKGGFSDRLAGQVFLVR